MYNLKRIFSCGYEFVSVNLIRILVATVLVLLFAIGMSSCGGDNKENEPVIDKSSGLLGTWFASGTTHSTSNGMSITSDWETIIIFNSRGNLLMEDHVNTAAEGGGVSYIRNDFNSTYKVKDNTVIIQRNNNGKSNEYILSYKIAGNNLILEYISGDEPSILHGKDMITYTNKSKIDIVEYPYGTWYATLSKGNIQQEFSLSLSMDNKLNFSEKVKNEQYYTTVENYRYTFSDNIINIFKEDNFTMKPDCILSFKVIGNKIVLDYESGDKPLFISAFNEDKVTFTKD